MKMTQRVGLFGVLVASLVMFGGLAQAQVPQFINYQGVLKDSGGTPISGTRSITFRIYGVSSGGTALWSETQSSVVLTGGLFNVLLGSTIPLPSGLFFPTYPPATPLAPNPDRWLGVTVSPDTVEMTPRQRMVSVGHSLKAEDADTLGDRIVITDKVNQFVGIGTPSPYSPLTINTMANTTLPAGSGTIIVEGALNKERIELRSVGDNTAATNFAPGPVIQGKGYGGTLANPTATKLGMLLGGFGGSGHDGTQIVTANKGQFVVRAAEDWTPTALGTYVAFTTTAEGSTLGLERVRITAAGDVGIGTSFPTARLQVAGNVRADAYLTPSSRDLKKDIVPLGQEEYRTILDEIEGIQMVRYAYKQEDGAKPHLGVIAEDSPAQILDRSGKAVSLSDYASFILAGLKAQSQEIQALKARIQALETKLSESENQTVALVE